MGQRAQPDLPPPVGQHVGRMEELAALQGGVLIGGADGPGLGEGGPGQGHTGRGDGDGEQDTVHGTSGRARRA